MQTKRETQKKRYYGIRGPNNGAPPPGNKQLPVGLQIKDPPVKATFKLKRLQEVIDEVRITRDPARIIHIASLGNIPMTRGDKVLKIPRSGVIAQLLKSLHKDTNVKVP